MRRAWLLLLAACAPTDWEARDGRAWDDWRAVPIRLEGRVTTAGAPLAGAVVTAGGSSVQTGGDGKFAIDGLPRHNALVEVEAPGIHPAVRTAWLARTEDVGSVAVDIAVEPVEPDVARLVFGGDVMFGRRFVDVDGTTPHEEPYPDREDALVRASDPAPGALDVLSRVAPLLSTGDWTSVNFESPFVRTPNTPHPEKPFVFYSDPATLPSLRASGIDYLGLGNNHVYDYLQDGLRQTLDTVEATQMPHAGAGVTPAEAWTPWTFAVRELPLAYFCATSIDGWRWDPAVSYVADSTKGGAADLGVTSDIEAAVGHALAAGDHPVVQIHTGVEYSYGPNTRVREHVANVLAAGAELVIGHHPHTAQGFSEIGGVFVAWSLGNLAFDGLRLETLLGAVVEVDLGPDAWERARVHPVYLEDFRPRQMTGPLASRALRQMAEFSEGLVVVEESGVGRIVRDAEVTWERRTIEVPVEVGADGLAVVDLRDHAAPDESALRVDTDAPTAQVRFGRDLMVHGTFEDEDVDEDSFEVARWDHTPDSLFPCREARSGVGALCSVRSYTDLDISVAPFRNRIRVFGDAEGTPEKDISLLGWTKADDAGDVDLRVQYHASFGETVFGEEVVGTVGGGTHDWTPFRYDFQVPDDLTPENDPELNPRAMRLFLDHQIPRVRARGRVAFDDFAMVGWSAVPESVPAARDRPHPNDFLKISAPPGMWTVTVELGRPR